MRDSSTRVTAVVADDHPMYRDGVVRALTGSGRIDVVAEVEDGLAALEAIVRLAPQVALVDHRMPGLDGAEVVARAARDGAPTRIVLLSAFTDPALVYGAIERGAAGYLPKESRRSELVEAVLSAARGESVLPPELAGGLVGEIRQRRTDYRPTLSAGVGLLTVASFLLTATVARAPVSAAGLIAEVAVLALVALATFLLSVVLARRADRIRVLLADADTLTAQALDAEQGERRRLAEDLHDHALQTLLVAGQELDELADARPDVDLAPLDAAVRGTVRELREVVSALHPYVLDEAGIVVALRRVADRIGTQAALAVTVDAPDDLPAQPHDRLLYGVARELLTNVAKHAGATHVEVVLADDEHDRRLEVSDDGRGLDPTSLGARLAEGHIGLASTRARVEGVGGSFRVVDTHERGTRIVVRVPRGGSAS